MKTSQKEGWICPKCGVSVSPNEKICPICAKEKDNKFIINKPEYTTSVTTEHGLNPNEQIICS